VGNGLPVLIISCRSDDRKKLLHVLERSPIDIYAASTMVPRRALTARTITSEYPQPRPYCRSRSNSLEGCSPWRR